MIVRSLEDRMHSKYDIFSENWRSIRLLLKEDDMGFSFHITVIKAGAELTLWYKHHLEAVFCLEGTGSITDHATGETFPIKPGTIYALDKHDKHTLKADIELKFVCVFNPPCTGQETHNSEGAYELVEEEVT